MNENELSHHGILGMHWGVHTTTIKSGSKTKKNSGSADYRRSRKLKSRGYKNLSDKELKELNQRLQMEKQLKDLDPTSYKKAMNVVKEVTLAGTTIASLYALSKTPLAQDIKKAVTG